MRFRFGVTVGFGILAAVFSAKSADAKDICSNGTLSGGYGLHATGAVIGGGNFAAVGRFIFDGKGNLAATLFVRVNGNNNTLTITGSYSVSPDCTVSDTWNASNGVTSTHESIIVDNGQGYFILNNTSGDGSVISGEARKQSTED
jgi:hypothetical protein